VRPHKILHLAMGLAQPLIILPTEHSLNLRHRNGLVACDLQGF
jgi:hypothetical protein